MLLLPALLGIAFAVPTTVVHLSHPKPTTSAAAADSSAVLFSRARELARAGHPSEALAAYHAAAVRADSPKAVLEEKLYGIDDELESNAIPVHVHHLRRKLQDAGASAEIHTVRGVGYLLAEIR